MHTEMAMQEGGELRSKRIRFRAYWISAALATLVFLMFTYTMSMVSGIYASQKLWMLTIEIGLLALSLGLGLWGFRTSEAPFTAGRLGLIVGVVLVVELVLCLVSVPSGYGDTSLARIPQAASGRPVLRLRLFSSLRAAASEERGALHRVED